MTFFDRAIKGDTTARTVVMRAAQALRPFRTVAVLTGAAFAVAGMVVVVLALALAQHQVLDAVVGSNAVDVVHDLALIQRASDVRLHDQAMLRHDAPLSSHDDEAIRGQRSAAALPGRGVRSVDGSLLFELALLGTSRGVGCELRRGPTNGLAAHCAGLSNCGHANILPQLQGV
jgi:hypothetical protein